MTSDTLPSYASRPVPAAPSQPVAARHSSLGRGYLVAWSALASVALAYLATLGLRPDLLPAALGPATLPPGQGTLERAAFGGTRSLGDLAGLREAIEETRREVGRVGSAVVALEDHSRIIAGRLASVEDRLETAPADAGNRPDGTPGQARPGVRPLDGQTVRGEVQEKGAPVTKAAAPPVPPGFGRAVVRPAREPVALQLATGPSLDALRLSWSLLQERHRGQLGRLEPRVVRGTEPGQPAYRLIAGPLTSAGEARRLCSQLKARRAQCEVAESFDGEGL
jgi:hypothetical protein